MEAQNNGPPVSQASGRVFRDSTDRSLRVFVEASDVLNRPKIVHTLKSNGATIVHSPNEAAIIIVDAETASGVQFVQEWGSEPGKVVLDVRWVQKSVERGSAYLANETWGGFCVSENASGTIQDPLPTPRDTPPDAQADRAAEAEFDMDGQPLYPPGGSQMPHPNMPFPYPSQQPPTSQQMQINIPSGTAIPPAGMQTNPNAQVVVPAHLLAQLVGLVSQQGINPASLGMPQMVPQMGNQMPMNMIPGQAIPQGFPFMPQPGMFVQQQYPPSQQPGMYPPQQMMPPPMMQPSDQGSPTLYQSPAPATPDRRSSMSQAQRHSSVSARGSPMEDVRSSSRKRKSPSVDSGRRAGKGRADGERSSKQRRVSYQEDEAPLPYPDSTSPSAQHRHEATSSVGQLFAQEDGEPYKFYVQIDIRPRTKIADAIKKHGGKLVPDIADADYVILGSHSARTFEERLKQAGNYGKLAVRPQWVFKCVEENEIVDLDEFVFEGLKVEKKRGRPSANGKRLIITGPNAPSTSKTPKGKVSQLLQDEDEDMAEDEEEVEDALVKGKAKSAAKGKAAPKEPVKKEKAKKPVKPSPKASTSKGEGMSKSQSKGKAALAKSAERSVSPKRYWRPSPPPPTRVVEHMPGKNMYTKEDDDYVDEYLPILFFRDPDITLSAMSEKLHAKMPHHTQKSWQSRISHPSRRDKFEKMRRQAHIARRKAAAAPSTQPLPDPVDSSISEAAQMASAPAQATTPPASIDLFTALAKFFAAGGADNLEDTEVWKAIHRQYPEVSAEAWEEYWLEHSVEIAAAVQQLSAVANPMGEGSEAPMQYGDGHIVPKPEPE